MNPFTAHKRLSALAVTLLAFGVDLEATDDVGAALQSKLDAAGAASKDQIAAAVAKATEAEREGIKATMEVLAAKATLLDLLDKQATASGIELAALSKDGALQATVDRSTLFEALDKQATAEGIDLRAMAKDGAIAAAIDSKSREIAKEVLGSNAPPKVGIDPGPDAVPTGLALARQYEDLCAKAAEGDATAKAEAEALFAAHSEQILSTVTLNTTH